MRVVFPKTIVQSHITIVQFHITIVQFPITVHNFCPIIKKLIFITEYAKKIIKLV